MYIVNAIKNNRFILFYNCLFRVNDSMQSLFKLDSSSLSIFYSVIINKNWPLINLQNAIFRIESSIIESSEAQRSSVIYLRSEYESMLLFSGVHFEIRLESLQSLILTENSSLIIRYSLITIRLGRFLTAISSDFTMNASITIIKKEIFISGQDSFIVLSLDFFISDAEKFQSCSKKGQHFLHRNMWKDPFKYQT